MYFGWAIKFRGNHTGGFHFPVNIVIESSLAFDVPKCLGKFVFKFAGRVLSDGLVSIGVSK